LVEMGAEGEQARWGAGELDAKYSAGGTPSSSTKRKPPFEKGWRNGRRARRWW
jgi:hypothetical protein